MQTARRTWQCPHQHKGEAHTHQGSSRSARRAQAGGRGGRWMGELTASSSEAQSTSVCMQQELKLGARAVCSLRDADAARWLAKGAEICQQRAACSQPDLRALQLLTFLVGTQERAFWHRGCFLSTFTNPSTRTLCALEARHRRDSESKQEGGR